MDRDRCGARVISGSGDRPPA